MIGAPLFVIYLAFTLVFVFGPALALRRTCGTLLAAALPSCIVSLALAGVFTIQDFDSIRGLVELFAWLTLPWFAGNLAGLWIWPSRPPMTPDVDCFS